MKQLNKILTFLFFLSIGSVSAQVSGIVVDNDGIPLIGVSVVEVGTDNGTVTGLDGTFALNVQSFPANIEYSYVGYLTTKSVVESAISNLSITLSQGIGLDEVVVTGSRGKPRTILNSAVPIDNVSTKELLNSGKPIIERMLTFKVPSFNSQNQAISDATAHYDPADLRGLGPSRTLVLVNGKRKNQSAQVYLNRTPGKGEVGVDLKSIPTAAIERGEVLRDGASAQYGSDAIAGVINMVLKKDVEYTTFTSAVGITDAGDGFNFSADFNKSFTIGDGGYANVTLGYYKQLLTNRANNDEDTALKDLPADKRPNEVQWVNDNHDLGMHVGQPDLEKKDLFVNFGYPLGENAEIYSFHGYTTRTGRSFAYYRAPYWRRDVADAGFITAPENFRGYQPTFETSIDDHINALGLKFQFLNGINGDASFTYGSNSVNYIVNNSVNRDYLADFGTSPRTFNPGGYTLSNIIGNLDFNKSINDIVNVAVGFEFKKEYFEAIEGNPLSYYGAGSDSFAGIKPSEAGKWTRNNKAIYAQVDFDITESLLLGGAVRYEHFSDFGSNTSFKVSGRYKITKDFAIRASYSQGFRAPTLHQRYLTNSQFIIVQGSSEPLKQGTLANGSKAIQDLGVPELFAETSNNIAAGLTYRFNKNFSASLDIYQIDVNDRILFSTQIGSDDDDDTDNEIEQILEDNNVVAVQFFINAGNTKTKGLDLVLNYRNNGFAATLAGNLNKTTLDAINTPEKISNAGYHIFDRQETGLIINSRPRSKVLLGLTQKYGNWTFGLNNTLFGKVTVTAPSGGFGADGVETIKSDCGGVPCADQELSSQLITDLIIGYKITDRFNLSATINNLANAYPDITLASTGTAQAGQRFLYSSEVQQQGQLGRNYTLSMNYSF